MVINMKILSFNIFEGCEDKTRFDQLIDFINKESPDVLGLLELNKWDEDNDAKLKRFLKETGFKNFCFCKTESGYHLALFSKFELEDPVTVIEGFNHGMIKAKVNLNNKPVWFVVIHLTPYLEDDRLKELEVLFANIPEEGNQVILMGDFNSLSPFDGYDEELLLTKARAANFEKFGVEHLRVDVQNKIMNQGFIDSFYYLSKKFESTVPTGSCKDHTHFVDVRLDYIFTSPNLVKGFVKASVLKDSGTNKISDHFPISLELNLTTG